MRELRACLDSWMLWDVGLEQRPAAVRRLGGGQTNQSFLLESRPHRLVIRIHHPDSNHLGVDRDREARILKAVGDAGIGPTLVYLDPERHYLVYPYLDGRIWEDEDFRIPSQVGRLQAVISRYQQIELGLTRFDYHQHLSSYLNHLIAIDRFDAKLMFEWQKFSARLSCFQAHLESPVLCHHDLNPANVLETENGLRILDWEYAASGHPLFDLAGLPVKPKATDARDMALIRELRFWLDRLWRELRRSQAPG